MPPTRLGSHGFSVMEEGAHRTATSSDSALCSPFSTLVAAPSGICKMRSMKSLSLVHAPFAVGSRQTSSKYDDAASVSVLFPSCRTCAVANGATSSSFSATTLSAGLEDNCTGTMAEELLPL